MVHISKAAKAAESPLAFALNGWRGVIDVVKGAGSPGVSPPSSHPPKPKRARPKQPQSQPQQPLAAPGGVIMGPAQEVVNALTMIPVAILALYVLWRPGFSIGARLVALSIVVHNPFSLLYHISCAVNFQKRHPTEGNIFLKLDLSFIHVAGMILSLATSGSLAYFATCVVFNSVCIYHMATWQGTTFQRRLGRLGCMFSYMAPVGLVDLGLCATILTIFSGMVAAFLFCKQLGGWGHSVSHVLLFPFTVCLIMAAGHVATIA
mmetsp:Transcript_85751/g.227887  ORF Transcript_85751/g.227887 Transcript_85751/m.227887 type:complete len:263 (-) Transcript_85751:264-1052(-)